MNPAPPVTNTFIRGSYPSREKCDKGKFRALCETYVLEKIHGLFMSQIYGNFAAQTARVFLMFALFVSKFTDLLA
jgi:hypothetical protein